MSTLLDLNDFVSEKLLWHQWVLLDESLGNRAKTVSSVLLHDLNAAHGGAAFRAQDGMAALAGLSVRSVQLGLEELEAAAHLRIERAKGRGNSNRYFALLPPNARQLIREKVQRSAGVPGERTGTKGENTQPAAPDQPENTQPVASDEVRDTQPSAPIHAPECVLYPLEKPLDSPLTPQAAALARQQGAGRGGGAANPARTIADIVAAFRRRHGADFVASWLAPGRIALRSEDRALICWGPTAAARLGQDYDLLRQLDVTMGPPDPQECKRLCGEAVQIQIGRAA